MDSIITKKNDRPVSTCGCGETADWRRQVCVRRAPFGNQRKSSSDFRQLSIWPKGSIEPICELWQRTCLGLKCFINSLCRWIGRGSEKCELFSLRSMVTSEPNNSSPFNALVPWGPRRPRCRKHLRNEKTMAGSLDAGNRPQLIGFNLVLPS